MVLNSSAKNAEFTDKEHACKGGISVMKAWQEAASSRKNDSSVDQEQGKKYHS